MDDTAKYLIHARIAADGVVERSDVVGAVFGQTEGLLGDELDLRDLQQSSKVGRIDVEISSENGQSFGKLTIATSLDKAETAVLGASLETIERVGPCRATIEVTSIEDVRAAKRREVVDRAKELLATAFDETAISSEELLADVRESVEVETITEYADLPAGPSVSTSDAIIIVEGRADVLQLLKHGIKNAIGVEGTNVPEAVAELTTDRTVTVFVDGDRGGELILRELLQVAEIDYVIFAPAGRSVEDLPREEIHSLLREKIDADRLGETQNIRETITGLVETSRTEPTTNGQAESTDDTPTADAPTEVEVIPTSSAETAVDTETATTQGTETVSTPDTKTVPTSDGDTANAAASTNNPEPTETTETEPATESTAVTAVSEAEPDTTTTDSEPETTADPDPETSSTLRTHIKAVIDEATGTARLLDDEFSLIAEVDSEDLTNELTAGEVPFAVVLDGELSQQTLDIAAQCGVNHIIARSKGEFVKQPVGTRVLTAEQLRTAEVDIEA